METTQATWNAAMERAAEMCAAEGHHDCAKMLRAQMLPPSKEKARQAERIKEAAFALLSEVRAVAEGATRTKHCQALLRALGEE